MSTIAAGITSGTALVSTGNTDGTLQLQVNGTTPSVTLAANGSIGVGSTPGYGTNGQVLTSSGTGSAPTWATVSAGFTLATPVSVSGTSVSFTGIPSGAKQIVLMFNAVKSNAAVNKFIQLGDSGGFITTGYVAQENYLANTAAADSFTDAWRVRGDVAATTQISGAMTFSRYNGSAFTYIGVGAFSYPQNDKATTLVSGIVTLTSVLTQIRVTVTGTTYDTGSINIAYI